MHCRPADTRLTSRRRSKGGLTSPTPRRRQNCVGSVHRGRGTRGGRRFAVWRQRRRNPCPESRRIRLDLHYPHLVDNMITNWRRMNIFTLCLSVGARLWNRSPDSDINDGSVSFFLRITNLYWHIWYNVKKRKVNCITPDNWTSIIHGGGWGLLKICHHNF